MTNSNPQPAFDPCSFAEIREILQQALPFLEKLVVAGHAIYPEKTTASTSLPCNSCSEGQHCPGQCDALNALLPKIHQERGHHEHFSKLDVDELQNFRKVRFLEIFEQYADCRHIFTHKQWAVVYLYYHDGRTEQQIAETLDKSRTTVSGLLNRARRRKEEYDKQIRREKFEYGRKMSKTDTSNPVERRRFVALMEGVENAEVLVNIPVQRDRSWLKRYR